MAELALRAPCFSVIVPTYNRPDALMRCLEALAKQDYPRDAFEVIVVDDGGDVALEKILARFDKSGVLRLVANAHGGGPAGARNHGAALARGRFLAFTDDDCEPAADWLTTLARAFERAPDAMVGGSKRNGLPNNPYSSGSQLIEDLVYAHYNADAERARFFASNNMALPADGFADIGGFDEGFLILACEDRELCDRWLHRGRPMRYAADAVVYHCHPLTPTRFFRQHFTYGRGAVHFHRIRAERGSGSMQREMEFHLNLPRLLRLLAGRSKRQILRWLPLLALWQAANLTGFVYESVRRNGYDRRLRCS